MEQLKEMVQKIVKLKGEDLVEIARLVRVHSPQAHNADNGQEVVLDVDKMDNDTLRKIHDFLETCQI